MSIQSLNDSKSRSESCMSLDNSQSSIKVDSINENSANVEFRDALESIPIIPDPIIITLTASNSSFIRMFLYKTFVS